VRIWAPLKIDKMLANISEDISPNFYTSSAWIRLVWLGFKVFNATFNNVSVISWRSVLLVVESGIPRENHWPAASHWQTLSRNVVSSTPHNSRDKIRKQTKIRVKTFRESEKQVELELNGNLTNILLLFNLTERIWRFVSHFRFDIEIFQNTSKFWFKSR
jgi:hypothetical protein